jgi:TPR repeat protein
LRAKALSGDAVVRRRLADALAKSSDPALQREAYAWYIVLGEMGDANAHRRARELNNKIPKNKIGEVRERVAAVFEQSVSSTQDLPKAYEWYLLAANSGANVQPQLEHLRRQMTPDEVRLAESTAHEWLQRQRVMSER